MRNIKFSGGRTLVSAIYIATLLLAGIPVVAQENVLHSFDPATGDGELSTANLVSDAAGNLYGTTNSGGANNLGTVFELSPASDGAWNETILLSFDGTHGSSPDAGLILGASGNLFGTTPSGGTGNLGFCVNTGCGVVFELSPASGGTWIQTILHNFNNDGTDGLVSTASLVSDGSGNLYGTTETGGAFFNGTVFELSPQSGGGWIENILYSFNNSPDGITPRGSLVRDAHGNLYGTTLYGGAYGGGTVFALSRTSGGIWTEKVLHSFNNNGVDGYAPVCGVTLEPSSGNLFGVTIDGGFYGLGTVFELRHGTTGGWAEKVLYNFNGSTTGGRPEGNLTLDASGSLLGTTQEGGDYSYGIAFKLTHSSEGLTETILHSFGSGTDAATPAAAVIFGLDGNLYGTTYFGGTYGEGAVFEVAP